MFFLCIFVYNIIIHFKLKKLIFYMTCKKDFGKINREINIKISFSQAKGIKIYRF